MRLLRGFAFLFSLLLIHSAYATPLHFNVKGTMSVGGNGSSPVPQGAQVTGWYELDWAKAKYETDNGRSTIYSGILTYKFTIGHLTLAGMNPNIEYHSSTQQISQNSERMEFHDLYPDFNIGSFLTIETLYFYISNKNGVRKASFSYDSFPDDINGYYGMCELADANNVHVLETSSLMIFIFGLGAILLRRIKLK